MGLVFVEGSGGMGSDTEEITARADDVVTGKYTIDANGERVQGTIRKYNSGSSTSGRVHGKDSSNLYIKLNAGYYVGDSSDGNKHRLNVPFSSIRSPLGVDSSKMLSGYSVAGVSGTIIKRRLSDKKSVDNVNRVYVWDSDTSKLCAEVKSGYYDSEVRDTAYISMNGSDVLRALFSNGRTVFNGAAFDGIVLTGAAENKELVIGGSTYDDPYISFNKTQTRGSRDDRDEVIVKYNGVKNGGLEFYTYNSNVESLIPQHVAGMMIKDSINLTELNKIRFKYNMPFRGKNVQVGDNARLDLNCYLIPINKVNKSSSSIYKLIDKVGLRTFYKTTGIRQRVKEIGSGTGPVYALENQIFDVDVSSLNGHYYLAFGIQATEKVVHSNTSRGRFCRAYLTITSIEIF